MTFDEFLVGELPGLSRYATVLTGDRQRAHDLLADALVKAQQSWGRVSRAEYPLAYVRRIVTTTFISENRRWAARHIRLTATGELPEVALADPTEALAEREHLSALLAALPPRQRAALVLRYYLGLDNAAAATELGISAGSVRTAVSRGLATLRIAVAAETAGDAPPAMSPPPRLGILSARYHARSQSHGAVAHPDPREES